MKKENKRMWYSLLLVPVLTMFFFTGVVIAQDANQDEQQSINKTQRFIDTDRNHGGFVSQGEYKFGSFAEYDTNSDGSLSRKEYRDMNRNLKSNRLGNVKQGINKGQGIDKDKCKSNGKGEGISQGNREGKGRGECTNKCNHGAMRK